MTRLLPKILTTITILLLQASLSWGEERKIAIITGPDFPKNSITIEEIKSIYLGEIQIMRSIRVIPIDQSYQREIRKKFLSQILHMTRDYYLNYWNRRLYLKGGITPLYGDSSAQLVEMVKNKEGSLGYVWLEEAEKREDIKVLLTIDLLE